MTDTGQIPGEGLPEHAGMVEQPGVPAPDAYTFLDPSEQAPEDDDLLLMPAPQGAWSDAPTAPGEHPAQGQAPDGAYDTGSVGLDGARIPTPAPVQTPAQVPVSVPAAPPTRRPLHRGPVEAPSYGGNATGGVVRSLADRGPAGSPQTPAPVRHAGPPTAGPEYFDAPADAAGLLPGPQLGEIPPQGATPWAAQAPGTAPAQPVTEAAAEAVQEAAPAPEPAPAPALVDPAPAPEAAPAPAPETALPEQEAPAETVVPEAAPGQPAAAVAQPQAPAEPHAEPARTLPEPAAEAAPESAVEPVAQPAGPSAEEAAQASSTGTMGGQFVAVDAAAPTDAHLAPEPAPAVEPEQEPRPEEPQQPEADTEPVTAEPTPFVEAAAARAAEAAFEAQEPVAAQAAEEVPAPESEPEPEMVETPDAETPGAEVPETEAPEPAADGPAPETETEAPATAGEPDEAAAETQPVVEEQPAVEEQAEQPEQDATATQPTAEAPAAAEQAVTADETPTADEAPAAEEPPAQEAPASPPAPGYDDAEREAVLRVMRERRDIRNGFRSDPIPHEVLLRVLEAAHTAPSVGHSQPWDFVVIRSAETRRSMHELAQRQREAYAKSLPKARAKQFKELKIEAILDTPVNIVVTADPTRGGRHTLGRHTQPQMAPYSSALAVENLWLAARAEGLGVGWVSFFDEREMVRELGLPEHLEVVAYLCVGYVDEFPEEPELMQAGWSKRRPLSWVVHEETYGRRVLPGEEPHDLLQETIANIRPLDAKALGEAWERQKRMTKPAGALGMLEIISAQLSGLSRMCPPPIPEPAAVAIFAGDHGVHAQGVTAWPQEVTGQMVANFLSGGAVCNAFAAQVGAEVCVVDVGVAAELPASPGLLPRNVRRGTADFTTGPALTREEVLAAIEVGIETARDLVAAGNKALVTGEMGIANTTASAALICVYTGMDPAEVTGRGTGINDEMHARKVDVVRRALELHQPDPTDPIGVLAAVGGLEHAAMAGFLLGGASLRTPVILDGVSAGASALVARAVAPEALAACIAGHRSAEPGHVAALNKLGLRPLVDLDLRLGEGTGALLALPIVQSAARAMHEVATFDSAGVTEK
ncbi:nicotinate-nucleotide--dimethylbenzimidazole phosphoribosyltransferase [Streptomyces sp. NPDC058330]|uniref:nicotinate-nucleotide--dimethylbenzimidazole phosphoribosyltransferase n=1 Tax=Streptomyces sp. NPDC058330 TaxID=3346449 RepID=UPI0036E42448